MRNIARLFSVCVAATLVLTACESGSGSGSNGRTSNARGSVVKIGFLVDLTGKDVRYPDALAGAKAAVLGIDARGGINGHLVELEWCDAASGANAAVECARTFVSSHVVAVVDNNANYGPQQTAVLQQAKVPEIVDETLNAQSEYTSPIEFPISSGLAGTLDSGVYYGVNIAHQRSYAFAGVVSPLMAAEESWMQAAVNNHGGAWKGSVAVSARTASLAPYAAATAAKYAQVVYLAMSAQQTVEFAHAAESDNYHFHAFVSAIAYTPRIIARLGATTRFAKAMLFGSDLPPVSATAQFPLLKLFASDMDAEARSGDKGAESQYRSIGQEEVWYEFHAVDVVISMIKRPITSASVLRELQTARSINLGLQPPWTPGAAGPSGFPRVTSWNEYILKLDNGRLVLAYPHSFDVEGFFVGQ